MKKLYCLELNGVGEPKEIEIRSFLSEETKIQIEEDSKHMGIKLDIKEISKPECFVQSYFEREGYEVFRTQYSYHDESNHKLKNLKGLPKCLDKHATESGTPDWFCFKSSSDWFFVEVKSETDSLRFNQVQWIIRNKHPTKLIFVIDLNKNDN